MPASQPTTTRSRARASGVANDRPTPWSTIVCSIRSTVACSAVCNAGVVSFVNTRNAPGLHRSPRSAHEARARYARRHCVSCCAYARVSAAKYAVATASLSGTVAGFVAGFAVAFPFAVACAPTPTSGANSSPTNNRTFTEIKACALRAAAR